MKIYHSPIKQFVNHFILLLTAAVSTACATIGESMMPDPTSVIPSCTIAAMIPYVMIHPIPHTQIDSKPVVTEATFITAGELRQQHAIDSSVRDATIVCFVILHGPFSFFGPPGDADTTYQNGFEVFDPKSGKLLVAGGISNES